MKLKVDKNRLPDSAKSIRLCSSLLYNYKKLQRQDRPIENDFKCCGTGAKFLENFIKDFWPVLKEIEMKHFY